MGYTLHEYHSVSRPWRSYEKRSGNLVGIELEMEHPHSRRAILDCLPEFHRDESPITERDGSLDDDTGVEIIFPPVDRSALVKRGSVFARSLRALDTAGAEPSSRTGMHVNVNHGDWAPEKTQAFAALINLVPRLWLTRIGGRDYLNNYCEQAEFSDWDDVDEDHTDHSAAAIKNNRVELRFPSATTNMRRVRNILAFVKLTEQYAGLHWHRIRDELNSWYDPYEDGGEAYDDMCARVTERFESWMSRRTTKSAAKVLSILRGELDGDA